jgi:hypothetical protein
MVVPFEEEEEEEEKEKEEENESENGERIIKREDCGTIS